MDFRDPDTMTAIVNSMGEGLLVIDLEYKIIFLNPVAEKLMGVRLDQAVDKQWSELVTAFVGDSEIPFEDRTSIVVIKTGQRIETRAEANHYYKTMGGHHFPVASITAPIKRNGSVVGAVKVFRDITEDKARQMNIDRKMEELKRINDAMVGREIKMSELKTEIDRLKSQLNGSQQNG